MSPTHPPRYRFELAWSNFSRERDVALPGSTQPVHTRPRLFTLDPVCSHSLCCCHKKHSRLRPREGRERHRAMAVNQLKNASPSKHPPMVCLLFVAGHNDVLLREIEADSSGRFEHLRGVPKALLPVSDSSDDTILGTWWREVKSRSSSPSAFLL